MKTVFKKFAVLLPDTECQESSIVYASEVEKYVNQWFKNREYKKNNGTATVKELQDLSCAVKGTVTLEWESTEYDLEYRSENVEKEFDLEKLIEMCISKGIATRDYPYSEACFSDIDQWEEWTEEKFPWHLCGAKGEDKYKYTSYMRNGW